MGPGFTRAFSGRLINSNRVIFTSWLFIYSIIKYLASSNARMKILERLRQCCSKKMAKFCL